MKKIIYGVFLTSIFFFSSCSKEESNVSPSQTNKESSSSFVTSTGESVFTDFVAGDGKTYSITKYDLSRMKTRSSSRTVSTITPRTVNAQLTQIIFLNAKLVITGSPFYSTGVYFCDVYKSEGTVTVPTGSFALFTPATGASLNGFVNYNNTTIQGSTATQFGNTYTYTTYSVVPRFNVSGQAINGQPIPRDLRGNVFSYLEFTP